MLNSKTTQGYIGVFETMFLCLGITLLCGWILYLFLTFIVIFFPAVVCMTLFIFSLPFVLGNGFYLFQTFNQFSGTIPLLLIAICEYIGIAWVYGTRKLVKGLDYPNP